MKKTLLMLALAVMPLALAGCSDADTVSYNLSKDADYFKVERRVVFYNGITGDYMLVIEGKCALGNSDSAGQLSVVCKTGEEEYKKHFLGLSDNVTYFVEQVNARKVDEYHYKVIFKPAAIIPDIDIR
jgi:hypothetical protein